MVGRLGNLQNDGFMEQQNDASHLNHVQCDLLQLNDVDKCKNDARYRVSHIKKKNWNKKRVPSQKKPTKLSGLVP